MYALIVRPEFVESQEGTPCLSDPATAQKYAVLLGELARHTREALLARMMRLARRTGSGIKPEWMARLQTLLEEDASAQAPWLNDRQRQAVGEVVAGFSRDPMQWLEGYLTEKQTEIFEWQKQRGAE